MQPPRTSHRWKVLGRNVLVGVWMSMRVLIFSRTETRPRGTCVIRAWRDLPERVWAFPERGRVGAARARQCPLRGDHEALWGCLCMALLEPTLAGRPENSCDPRRGVCGKGTGTFKEREQGQQMHLLAQNGAREGSSAVLPLRPAPFPAPAAGLSRGGSTFPQRSLSVRKE